MSLLVGWGIIINTEVTYESLRMRQEAGWSKGRQSPRHCSVRP